MIDLKALEELAKKATPGPWRARWAESKKVGVVVVDASDIPLARLMSTDAANPAFIAAANPESVLALVARIRELEESLRRIAEHPHNVYPQTSSGDRSYDIGVTDGHRCAAQFAALSLGLPCPNCGRQHDRETNCTAFARSALGGGNG